MSESGFPASNADSNQRLHGEYKVPGGKLVVVDLAVVDGALADVSVSGDFFLEPDEALEDINRALTGLPLGVPRLLSPVAMINLLGDLWQDGEPRWAEALRLPGVRLHLYGKAEPRPGRKMGHLNCLAVTPELALALARQAFTALSPVAGPVAAPGRA